MKFKLIIVLAADSRTNAITTAARDFGATGCTVITSARGEGLKQKSTFFGLTMEDQVDVILFIVEEHMARTIMEGVAEVAGFDEKPDTGVAFQIDIEDAIGLKSQIGALAEEVKDQL